MYLRSVTLGLGRERVVYHIEREYAANRVRYNLKWLVMFEYPKAFNRLHHRKRFPEYANGDRDDAGTEIYENSCMNSLNGGHCQDLHNSSANKSRTDSGLRLQTLEGCHSHKGRQMLFVFDMMRRW